jgi:ABC-type uncharacterized transport system auxiliary subunit
MRRRALLALLLLAGCSVLPQRGYPVRRDWPLVVRRGPPPPRSRAGRPILLVRAIAAGPGLEGRGLVTVQPDGSVHSDYYEQWVVPPAEAVTDLLRQWLAESGAFRAVLAPGSVAPADLVLEGTLTELDTGPDASAGAALSFALIDEKAATVRVLRQDVARGAAKLGSADPAARVAAMRNALGQVFVQVEAACRVP